MKVSSLAHRAGATAFAALLTFSFAVAQPVKDSANQPAKAAEKEEFQPQSGQAGKDVVWVPTPQALVDTMLDMAAVTSDDYVIDLGSGDGRTVITAAKRGAKALGIEYNPDMVALSRKNAAKEDVGEQAQFKQGDIFESDFSDATVVTLFLLPSLNVKLRPIILEMKPGTRVVSNSFDMGDWQPDQTAQAQGECSSWCRAHFWMVPAQVNGNWNVDGGELTFDQKYQMVEGSLRNGHINAPVQGKVIGDRIYFTAGTTEYSGRVNGDMIEGTATTGGAETAWKATR